MQDDLRCPNCSELVPDSGVHVADQPQTRHHQAVCPQCGATLLRHPGMDDASWQIENPAAPADEELGVGD